MMADKIGANFPNELSAAGLIGLPFSWSSDGSIYFGQTMTSEQMESVNAVLAAHDPTKPDPVAAAATVLAAGIAIVSTSMPAINGTYAIQDSDQGKIVSEQAYVGLTGKFTTGESTRPWVDINGDIHVFTSVALWTGFAEAAAQYVSAVIMAKAAALAPGGTWSPPTLPVTIP